MAGANHRFRVRTEKCEDCLYAQPHSRDVRERILGEVERRDSFVQCHSHDAEAHVCCRGYFDAVGERGGTPVQLAIRLERLAPGEFVEHVKPEDYPRGERDDGPPE